MHFGSESLWQGRKKNNALDGVDIDYSKDSLNYIIANSLIQIGPNE